MHFRLPCYLCRLVCALPQTRLQEHILGNPKTGSPRNLGEMPSTREIVPRNQASRISDVSALPNCQKNACSPSPQQLYLVSTRNPTSAYPSRGLDFSRLLSPPQTLVPLISSLGTTHSPENPYNPFSKSPRLAFQSPLPAHLTTLVTVVPSSLTHFTSFHGNPVPQIIFPSLLLFGLLFFAPRLRFCHCWFCFGLEIFIVVVLVDVNLVWRGRHGGCWFEESGYDMVLMSS